MPLRGGDVSAPFCNVLRRDKGSAMSDFETDGFLSDQVLESEAKIVARYKTAFDIATKANQLAHTVLFTADVHNEDGQELLYITLLTKQARAFQGFILLLKRGLLAPAQVLLRNMAETMFIVGALGQDRTFGARYIASEEIARKKLLSALVKNAQQRGEVVAQETKDLIASIEKRIKDEKITAFRIEQIAEIAKLTPYYDSLYRFTSTEAHTSARSLEDALIVEDGVIVSLKYEPVTEKLDMYLHYGISMMLHSLHECSQHFAMPLDAIEAVQKTNNEVAESSQKPHAAADA